MVDICIKYMNNNKKMDASKCPWKCKHILPIECYSNILTNSYRSRSNSNTLFFWGIRWVCFGFCFSLSALYSITLCSLQVQVTFQLYFNFRPVISRQNEHTKKITIIIYAFPDLKHTFPLPFQIIKHKHCD